MLPLLAPLILIASPGPSEQGILTQKALVELVNSGQKKETVPNNGTLITFTIGNLKFTIKDAAGQDPVVGFHHSDIRDDYYAVLYQGAIVVVPGNGTKSKYGREVGVYISPSTGEIYESKSAFMASLSK